MSNSPILLTPGPVPIPNAVLAALGAPIVHHRTPEFEATLKFCLNSLKQVFQSEHVIIHSSTGSGAMESAIVNTLSPGDEVICVISGKFGERWAYIAERYGMQVQRLEVEWGEAVSLPKFEECLEAHPKAKAVLTQACETSTATLNPVREMARLVNERTQALFMVDAITAAGCMEMPARDWGIDVVVAGSQKAFMLPTGMSFLGLSKRAVRAAGVSRLPKFYLDWHEELKANEKVQTYFSSPTSMLAGLAVVLKKFEVTGMTAVQKRCEALADATRRGARALELESFSKSPSPSVTAITLPSQLEGEKLRDWLEKEKSVIVMGGQDKLKNKILRVGHMGDIRDEDMIIFFRALVEGLSLLRFDCKSKLPKCEDELRQALASAKRLFA